MVAAEFLDIRGLSLSIGETSILKDVSFSVKKGECLCVIGPNGAGKSTLLKCVGLLHRDFSGTVKLDGVPLASMKRRDVARRIAWVHQSGADALPFTVREFARMSRYPWRDALGGETKADEAAVARALELSGVSHLAERSLASLSGGERQRSLIAAALAQGTDILFLDEPTSFLDYRHQVETLALIEKINIEEKMTILLVTHDINLAIRSASSIVAIRGGRMAWRGTSAELLGADLLRDIFDTEFETLVSEASAMRYVAPRGLMI